MPAVTPDLSNTPDANTPDAGTPVPRRSSWAEAAAAADQASPAPSAPIASVPAPTRRPARPPVTAQPQVAPQPGPDSDIPAVAYDDAEAAPPSSYVPDEAPEPAPAFRRIRPTAADVIADSPMPDFISSPGLFVREQKPRPVGGVRGALYAMTGGAWNLGPSAKQREEDELGRRISRQLQGSYNTAVLSLKGGIGKTSTTVGVGLTLAEFRGDPPCAIDANPDSGDLVERALGEGIYQQASPRTITDLLANIEGVDSLTALARYMHHAGRLHLIAGEQDPEVSDSLTAAEYLRIRKLISNYYSVALTDCGTGVTHNAMSGILQSADNIIIAAGYAVSGAKRARSTLHWLASHGYEDLARNAIVVITDKEEVSSRVDKDAIEEHLAGICRQLIAVPHDRGVADGDLVTLDVLKPETRRAYKEIAASIVDGYR
ncbi:MinD/ParA family protein [Pseudarthrobacter psychrotolerans]|uniref:MinD/ParA family protein n=1 Tax=Pseudarthrobacter psychrotolerans TaxID=2697569 RepID=A0A6P1NLB1_9MICC|nr:MinD/ParA family protein [Pseudarthrobacter psychrotolerans]QHK20108.1 MinD/ParA family protein [Pseudarthrobacter psychrotolerans]